MAKLIKKTGKSLYNTVLGDLDGKFADASVCVGGSSVDKFVPNINASKWNDEAWININDKATVVGSEVETLADGKIVLEAGGTRNWDIIRRLSDNGTDCLY